MIEIKEITAAETWPTRHKTMWPNKPLEFVILPQDDEGIHYGLFVDNTLVSVISLFIDGKAGHFRKFATDEAQQGKGYGSKILNHLINEATKHNIERLTCSARLSAISFYEKFGFNICSEITRKNDKDYIEMELIL
ncbi:GCN5-related N-acetyltransferase [Emticicia oligotrophica DSM 17448]|uniref:GCN5-related N-acetyltransferase n=1 Tax=Emticicia oligotrophica (strain DSM 17448 / CIP 109782 / MTCC 6937 / GPTSA100-15) TaxID=929562 RepID=A0ABM5N7D5_EMTOG|nr:GNAT family N-acetyltransferase [Emticicia oligotrophica]AFK05367.1 GCN5-related N-acetyltransferase [Emticicia oligotrophica DSM 17448]